MSDKSFEGSGAPRGLLNKHRIRNCLHTKGRTISATPIPTISLPKKDVVISNEVKIGKFITKDSGERQEYPTGMKRDTQDGKPNFNLIIPKELPYEDQLFTRLAYLMTRGAVKYGDRNWELSCTEEELERFKSSAFRHFMQWICGEIDEDHAAAVVFNIQCAEYAKHRLGKK